MFDGYKKVFWGMLLTMFHLNLGAIQILPNFIAILIICSGIKKILVCYDNTSIRISLQLFQITVAISFITFVLTFLGIESRFDNIILNIICFNIGSILEIMSIVKLLEGTSEVLSDNYSNCVGDKYKNIAIYYTYFYSVVLIASNINYIFMGKSITLIIAIYAMIIKILIVFSFRKLYEGNLQIS